MTPGRFLLGTAFLLSLAAGLAVMGGFIHFWIIPLAALAAGAGLYAAAPRRALEWLLFALPWTAALPALDPNGYPFNYLGVPLFFLSGMILVSMLRREGLDGRYPVISAAAALAGVSLLSALFLILRWSNLTLAGNAFFRDTPVSPDGQRLSFAIIFPVIALLLVSVSPHLLMLLRRHGLSRSRALNHLSAGYGVCLAIALIQRFLAPSFLSREYFVFHHQFNGGASDFNSFGFLSGFLFLATLLRALRQDHGEEPPPSVLQTTVTLAAALAGLVLSGSRTGFLFVLAALAVLLAYRGWRLRTRVLILTGLLLALAVGGGVLRHRVEETFSRFRTTLQNEGWAAALDRASNQRLTMLRSGLRLMSGAPVAGVGVGNFLFALKNLHFRENHLEDLPLNQYVLSGSETGVIGLMLFLLVLWRIGRTPRQRRWRPLYWTILAAFFVGTPLWLPELALLFWFTAWLLEPGFRPRRTARFRIAPLALLAGLVFLAGSVREFGRLHPVNWCRSHGVTYDYGFWPADTAPDGHTFQWTRDAAGIFLPAASKAAFQLVSEAPYQQLDGGNQLVCITWRGKEIHRWRTRERREWPLRFTASRGGFLEFRVYPAFNLRALGLGREGRTLGIQVHSLHP